MHPYSRTKSILGDPLSKSGAFRSRLGCDCEPATTAHPLDRLNIVKLSAAFETFEQFEITLFMHDLDLGYEFI